ncbi:F0F1 ATP synthase subunit B family protein [Streptomyces chryseus]|uniref:F0F1 ATP synthase subunit B family protein n=1 Tax=Streptomyces chryseus TaxID=68186 RepID=UPI00110FCB88|nr:hypothetical protein [Streptomyces chryseus]GGX15180.1 hypothetical protein GCM10010353_33040 [Streptomyces chryseus]
MDLGPLNPRLSELVVAFVTFGAVVWALSRVLLPRLERVLAQREAMTGGREKEAEELRAEAARVRALYDSAMADARRVAARARQEAHEEGAALTAAARADGMRLREQILADGAVVIAAERAAAEAVLRPYAEGLARDLAGRILGEPVPAPADGRP